MKHPIRPQIVNVPWACKVPCPFGSRDNNSDGLTQSLLQGFRTFNPFRKPR